MSNDNSNTARKQTKTRILGDGADNAKISKSCGRGQIAATLSLPAIESCPMAGVCKKGCYACVGRMGPGSDAYKRAYSNFVQSKKPDFVQKVADELSTRFKSVNIVRIHPSGDIYSRTYLDKLVQLAVMFPDIQFYGYTKSVQMVKSYFATHIKPENFTLAFSYGGIQDHLINPETDIIAVVTDPDKPIPAGYTDGSNDDFLMLKGIRKIALPYHGTKKYKNTEWNKIIIP